MTIEQTNRWRADKLTPEEDAARLAKIHRVSERAPQYSNDSRVDYDDPAFHAVAPTDWSRRHG